MKFDTKGWFAAITNAAYVRHMSWAAVSAATGVSTMLLSRLKNGHRDAPDGPSLVALSKWAGVNPLDYVGGVSAAPLPCPHCSGTGIIAGNGSATIEVVGEDMQCFKVDARTLEPIGSSYYEPAALRDSQGREQISVGEWNLRRNALRGNDAHPTLGGKEKQL